MNMFTVRGFNMCESLLRHTPEQLRRFLRRMKSLDFNTVIIHYDYGWHRYHELIAEECKAAGVEITLMTFAPRTFFEMAGEWTPEWFAKRQDGSPFTSRPECETFPCRFAPGALEAFERGAQRWLQSLPDTVTRIHARAGDGQLFCECPRCRQNSVGENWQPFVERFVAAARRCRPELAIETDVYCYRYDIPQNRIGHRALDRIMVDVFPRAPQFAITDVKGAPSTHPMLRQALENWCREFPGKIYVHENAMKQGFYGVFQHGTRAALRDLDFFESLDIQGVCYEAYEPGYSAFSTMFETLSRRLKGENVPLPQDEAARWCEENGEWLWGIDSACDLGKFIDDPIERHHAELIRQMYADGITSAFYRRYAEFVLNHQDCLDWLYGTYTIAHSGFLNGKLRFANLSETASDFLTRRKLWDFMEDIPLTENPRQYCGDIVHELLQKMQ